MSASPCPSGQTGCGRTDDTSNIPTHKISRKAPNSPRHPPILPNHIVASVESNITRSYNIDLNGLAALRPHKDGFLPHPRLLFPQRHTPAKAYAFLFPFRKGFSFRATRTMYSFLFPKGVSFQSVQDNEINKHQTTKHKNT